MQIVIEVENIKCGGCANSITGKLKENEHIQDVTVDIENGAVTLETDSDAIRDDAISRLLKMGYPEKGSVEGLASVKAKASSFVSCAVGRMSEDEKS